MKNLRTQDVGITLEEHFKPNNDVSLKVLLAVPPQSHPPTAPHPGLPYLKGYLEQVLPNVSITQKDLDAIYFSYVFSQEELTRRFPTEQAARIRDAYQAQRDIQVYKDVSRFIQAHSTLEDALDEISRQHQETHRLSRESLRLRGNTFTYISEFPVNSRQGILDAISPQNREKNLFYQYYRDVVVPHITSNKYDVVGLSVFLTDQLLPTFLLAQMIKEQSPKTKVILGGNYLTRFRKTLSIDDQLNRDLFDYSDAIVVNEGEVPFRKILERVSKGEDFEGINQVIYRRKDGKITVTFNPVELPVMDMDRLPRPDFEGIFTDLENKEAVFWTPSAVIPFYTQRGCPYAGGCDFCTIMSANNKPNSKIARSPEKVAEDIAFFYKKYGASVFSFGNETLSRGFMLGLTEELDKKSLEVIIDGYTRTDQFHNGDLDIEMIRRIGKYFRFLQIGVESTDEETLDSMRKGRKPFKDSDLVKALYQNGTFSHAFLIIGFPPDKKYYEGRDRDDYINFYMRSATSTLKWLADNAKYLGTFKATTLRIPRDDHKMVLETDSKFVVAPRYAHELSLKNPKDLEFNIPYKKIHGSTEFDYLIAELFDMVWTPYRTFTHYTIYHQRLFNWEDGIRWSIENPESVHIVSPTISERERKVVRRIWALAVGQDYLEAMRKLSKKGGINRQERERLQNVIAESRQKNIMTRNFPEGVSSINELVNINF